MSPTDGAAGVPTNVTLSVTFSEAMDTTTISDTSFILRDAGANAVTGNVSYQSAGNQANFAPAAPLAYSATYAATVTTAARDVAGNAMAANHSWSFTTVAAPPPDTTPPTVERTRPINRANGAALAGPITAEFSEPLDQATVTTASVLVTGTAGAVSGSVSLSADGLTVSFTPTTPFPYTARYDVELTTAITDLAGNPLAANHRWFFNTGKRLAVGESHSCARLDDGGVKCWGANNRGQLGIESPTDRGSGTNQMGVNLPRVILGSGRTAVQIVAGAEHSCARLDNDRVKCWGYNFYGQLGIGDRYDRGQAPGDMTTLPEVALGTGNVAVELVAGAHHTCARLHNGSVKCWGGNDVGQLGLGDTDPRGGAGGQMGVNLPVVDLGAGRLARSLTAGWFHNCARLEDSSVKCWGGNDVGQLGLEDTVNRGDGIGPMGIALPAVNLGAGRTVVGMESGLRHSCARLDDATTKCWGWNLFFQLGLGDNNNRGDGTDEMGNFLPALDFGAGRSALGLAAGGGHSCARLDNGTLRCWGANADGQLGLGNAVVITSGEVNIGVGRTVAEMATFGNHTCARFDNGEVKCWGYNLNGQLGLGTIFTRGDDANETVDQLPVVDIGN